MPLCLGFFCETEVTRVLPMGACGVSCRQAQAWCTAAEDAGRMLTVQGPQEEVEAGTGSKEVGSL
jgi:hypothetical protein